MRSIQLKGAAYFITFLEYMLKKEVRPVQLIVRNPYVLLRHGPLVCLATCHMSQLLMLFGIIVNTLSAPPITVS